MQKAIALELVYPTSFGSCHLNDGMEEFVEDRHNLLR
jgi:hypothetical protein